MDIAKGKIGNALTSTAADHVVATAADIYDEKQEQYQERINDDTATRLGELAGYQFMHNDEYMFAITDSAGYVLWGIRFDGTVYQPKGIPEEVRTRLNELSGLQMMENDRYAFAIVDSESNVVFGIERDAHIVMQNGLTLDGWKGGLHLMNDENYLLAIVDAEDRMLFGIHHDGSVCTPKGVVEVMTWDEYEAVGQPHKNTLYAIQGTDGSIRGAFINGAPLACGEEYAFLREENMLYYHGRMSVMPKIWTDYDSMELKVDYPSGYSGPMFIAEDGMLFLI